MKYLVSRLSEKTNLSRGVFAVSGALVMTGCFGSSGVAVQEEIEIQQKGSDQNVEGHLFADFDAFYSSIYFKDGSQPKLEFTDSFFFEINDAVEKTGIEEFRAQEFYTQHKDDSEVLRSMILRLNRARWVRDLFE